MTGSIRNEPSGWKLTSPRQWQIAYRALDGHPGEPHTPRAVLGWIKDIELEIEAHGNWITRFELEIEDHVRRLVG